MVEWSAVNLRWADGAVSSVDILRSAVPALLAEGAVIKTAGGALVAPQADVSADEIMAVARHVVVPAAGGVVLVTSPVRDARLVSEAVRLARLGLRQGDVAALLTEGGFRKRSGRPIAQVDVSDILLAQGVRRRSPSARRIACGGEG
jgi:hypothetical protein